MPPVVNGYDELRLRIDRREDSPYHVLASTHSAEASASFEFPFNEREVESFVVSVSRPRGHRGVESSAMTDARHFGGRLFKALFQDDIRSLYRDTLAQARSQGRGVRLTFCLSGAPELIDVPWEYLYDEPDFLAVSAFTPVVRYLDLPRANRPLMVEPPLRVLGVVSSPAEYDRLDLEREQANLERALTGLRDTGAVELHWLERPTLGALLQALQTQTFHVLHYIGHGTYDHDAERGALLFEDDSGWSAPVSGDKLGTILHDFSSLRLAVLNACEGARTARSDPFAGVAGSLVRRDIPAVVAMQFEISDEAAIVFARGFYEPIAAGSPVDASLAGARLAMLAERSDDIEWGTPVLFMRVPDGRIFALDGDGQPTPGRLADERTPVQNGRRSSPGALSVFVNYRREDTSGHALLLTDRLGQHFGTENVHLAVDHQEEIDRLQQAPGPAVFLVLMGPTWVASLSPSQTGHGEDVVRREIERALRDTPDRVVPVLVDAPLPDAETLPRSLRALCRMEPSRLRHASFETDVAGLITRLEIIGRTPPRPRAIGKPAPGATASLAHRSSKVAAGVSRPYRDHYTDVLAGMLDGTVVPLLGPGVRGSPATADELATPLAEQFQTEQSGLPAVAQRVAVTLGERRLYTAIKDLVAARSEPSDAHRFLAEFPGRVRQLGLRPSYQLIINANYDSGLEQAFEDAHEPFDYAVYLAASGWFVHVPWGEHASEPTATTILEPRRYVDFPIDDDGQLGRTVIVKIHGGADGHEGTVTWRNNYVVTEDHYIDYLPTHNIQDHLPIQILDKLTGSRCLFLGYALRSWNARVFLRRIWRGNPISENSWAIEQDPDLVEKASWNAIGHVELLASGLTDYVNTLGSMLSEREQVADLQLP